MKQLPNDILSEIFLHLHESDRTECVGVCLHWKRVLEDTALYQTVTLFTIDNLRKLLVKIQDEPDIAKKIQQLYILFNDRNNYQIEINQLLLLLPNIRFLFCAASPYSDPGFLKAARYPWNESIEHFEDRGGPNSLIFPTLSTSIFPNLSALVIFPGKKGEVLPLLKNTPVLEKLTLIYGGVTLSELDTIHRNTPNLRSLTLEHTSVDSTVIDGNVIPAVSVSQLNIGYLYIDQDTYDINLLVYISKKYPNLTELSFDGDYDNIIIDDDQIEYINTNGWDHVFRNMGPQLKTLTLGSGSGILNLFEKLNESRLQIHHLNLFLDESITLKGLIQSQQIHSIHTLSITQTDIVGTHEWLKKFSALQSLELYGFPSNYVSITDILTNSPPTLKALILGGCILTFDLENNDVFQLESLSLSTVFFPEKMDTFINKQLPSLSKLTLYKCKIKQHTWNLPALNLSLFQTNFAYPVKHYQVIVKTFNDNESRLYSVIERYGGIPYPDGHPLKYRPYKSYPGKEISAISYFTLNCNSLKSIFFDI